MKYLKLFETKRSDDAIQEFKRLANKDYKYNDGFYRNLFLSSDLSYEVQDEFKL